MKILLISTIFLLFNSLYAFELPPDIPAEGENIEMKQEKFSFPYNVELKAVGSYINETDNDLIYGKLGARMYGNSEITTDLKLMVNINLYTQFTEYVNYDVNKHLVLKIQEFALNYDVNQYYKLGLGRINVRNGIATGFSPTDWFKKDSLIQMESLDSKDRREDRLGIVVLENTLLFDTFFVKAGYKPRIDTDNNTVLSNEDIVGLDLQRTNTSQTLYSKFGYSNGDIDFAINGIYDWDRIDLTNDIWGAGAEFSIAPLGNLVVYGEWAGSKRDNLAGDSNRFYNQLASGFTYSLPEALVSIENITVSLEYHMNEAGVDKSKMDDLWETSPRDAGIILAGAANLQEPAAQHQVFGRLTWNNVFDSDYNLSSITTYVPEDRSGFTQLGITHTIANRVNVELLGYQFFGVEKSIYGSAKSDKGVSLSIRYTL